MQKKSFTLLELMMVIVIIGILATIALPNFGPMKERAFDKEAQANLKLIMAAARIWRMENNTDDYYSSSGANATANITDINQYLKLSLPAAANRNWNYTAVANNTAPKTCCAQATRNGWGGRNWKLNLTNDTVVNGTCP